MKPYRSEPNRKVSTRRLHFKAKRETCQVFYKPIKTFDTLANDYYCEPIVDDILGYLESYFVPTPPPGPPNFCNGNYGYWDSLEVFSRCHIVDMNPYNEYFVATYSGVYTCSNSCDRRTWRDGYIVSTGSGTIQYPKNITYNPNTYIGRTFNGFILNCTNHVPSSFFK